MTDTDFSLSFNEVRQPVRNYSPIFMLPVELWCIIGSLTEGSLCSLALTCHFLSDIIYPLLYRDIVCNTPSILLRCGTAWLNRPMSVFPFAKTLTVGANQHNSPRFQNVLERLTLLGKWNNFIPIFTCFSKLTDLKFVSLHLPRTFLMIFPSLPLLETLSLDSCTFDGPISFNNVKLAILRLQLKDISWDNQPDEFMFLQTCPALKVLFLNWHQRLAGVLSVDNVQLLPTTLYDLTVMSANYAWSRNRLQRLQQQQTFFNFIGTLRGLKRLTLSGGWPICETEAFPLGKQALPEYLESYIGPVHFFRSAPVHCGLKTAAFTERHISASELLLHLPSLPNATRIAVMGICLEDDVDNEASPLDIIFKQCPNIKEFLFDSAHVPDEGAVSVVNAFRRSIHRLHMIEYIIVPRISGTDLQPSEAFNPLHDICSTLVGVQFQEKMWIRMGDQWNEIEV